MDMIDRHLEIPEDREYRDKVAKVEPYGIEVIPESERHGKVQSQFSIYFAGNLSLASLVTGFYPVLYGLSIWQALSAVIVGSALGGLVMGLLATLGARMGMAQQVMGRAPLGYWANFLPVGIVSTFAAVGWCTVTSVFGAWALQGIFDMPFWLAAAIICFAHGALAVFGYNMIHWANRWSTIIFCCILAIMTVLALKQASFNIETNPSAPYWTGSVFGGWVTSAGLFFGYLLTWSPFASDFSRYLPANTKSGPIVLWTALGNFAVMAWLGCLGVVLANFAGELNPILTIQKLTTWFAPVTLLAIAVASVCSCALNSYGGALSLLTMRLRIRREVGAALISLAAFLLALVIYENIYGTLYDFVSLTAYLIAPYMTVIGLDYLLLRRGARIDFTPFFDQTRYVEWGFFAWLAGVVASVPFWVWTRYTGPFAAAYPEVGDLTYYVGAFVGGVVFLLTYRLKPLSGGRRN